MNEKRKQFVEDLNLLLDKHGVVLTADDHYPGYAECGQDIRITAEFDDWEVEDIDLGSYVDHFVLEED